MELEKEFLPFIKKWYPELHTEVCFCPSFYFTNEKSKKVRVGGENVHVIQPKSDISTMNHQVEDRSQMKVLTSFRSIASSRPQEMMVITKIPYRPNQGSLSYPSATDSTIETNNDPSLKEGDCDILIIHRKYGVIIGEIKGTGDQFNTTDQLQNKTVRNAVKKALDGLSKQLKWLQTILKEPVPVTKIVMLPNITSSQLKSTLQEFPMLTKKQDRPTSFGLGTTDEEFINLCLCSDIIDYPDEKLNEWWEKHFKDRKPEEELDTSLYESLVARFIGLKSVTRLFYVTPPRIRLRTKEQGVAEVSRLFSRIALYPKQLELLDNEFIKPVFLTGPPGTGKTIVLLLKGLRWLQQGHHVHVISTWYKSKPASFYLEHRLKKNIESNLIENVSHLPENLLHLIENVLHLTENVSHLTENVSHLTENVSHLTENVSHLTENVSHLTENVSHLTENVSHLTENVSHLTKNVSILTKNVRRVHYDLMSGDVENACQNLASFASDGKLYVLVDEPGPDIREDALQLFKEYAENKDYRAQISKSTAREMLITSLSMTYEEAEKQLESFREEYMMSVDVFQNIYSSSNFSKKRDNKFKDFCNKLRTMVKDLHLWVGAIENNIQPDDFIEQRLTKSLRSPPAVLEEIRKDELIRQGYVWDYTTDSVPAPSDGPTVERIKHQSSHNADSSKDCHKCGEEIAKFLEKRNVGRKNIQFRDVIVLCEDPYDDSAEREACGLVKGLRSTGANYPVRVVGNDADDEAIKDTALATTNMVTVSHFRHAHGLERMIVVLAANLNWKNNYNRMYDMSRCTAQLVLVEDETLPASAVQ